MFEMASSTLGEIGKVCMCKRILKEQTSPIGEIPFYKISTFGARADCYISREIYEDYKQRFSFPKRGDILISAAGTIGRTVRYDGSDAFFQDSNIVWIDNDESKVTNDYLYYFYQTNPWVKTHGSTIERLYNDNIRCVKISYPTDLGVQRKIVGVLKTIDDKIANNNAICAELEAMAKLLYDYWFVQFDFPDENGKPYKSSGSRMVWSEELKREIPEGWEVKTIGDISRMVNDSITPNKSSMYHHFSIPAFDDTHMPVYEPGASIDSNKYCVNDDYILVSKLNPQFKRIWVISKAPENSICSTEYMPFVSTNDAKEFLYSTLNSDAFYTFMVNSSSSSTGSRKRMPPEMCPRFKIPYPKNGSVVTQYCNAVKPMLDRANSMYSENQELASLRDFLLPLLMNGQVVINSDE